MGTRTIHFSEVQVIGTIWLPAVTAAYTYSLSEHDVQNIHPVTRESVEQWLMTHAGDFQHIEDFHVDIWDSVLSKDIVIEWSEPESEYTFSNLMYPSEE